MLDVSCLSESVRVQLTRVRNLMSLPSAVQGMLSVLFLIPSTAFSARLVQKNPPVRPTDANSPVLISDIDPKLAKNLPRNFRTTDDPLEGNTGQKIPADTGLTDLHASGGGGCPADGLKLLLGGTRGSVTGSDLVVAGDIFCDRLTVSGV